MKKFILLYTFLIALTGFSQNYHYAIETPSDDLESPTAPLDLIVSNITRSTADLTWTASTDNVAVTNYRVYHNGILLVGLTGNVTTYTLTELSADTEYQITVRAIDGANNESTDSNIATFTTLGFGPNMIDETIYFDCYLLPLAQKDQIQEALDTYGCIRLEKGNYGRVDGTPINIGSNQSIYGHPSDTEFPNVNILPGSTNVHLENLYTYQIEFKAGAPITNSVIKNIRWAKVISIGGMIEDNLFVNLRSTMNFDFSSGGYYRNNRVYRHQAGTDALILKGNSATPGYGNVHSWSNYLTPDGSGAILDNMGDITFIGVDSEGWNYKGASNKAMFVATNMGDMKIADIGGATSYNTSAKIPGFDIEANNIYFFKHGLSNQGSNSLSVARGNTNVLSLKSLVDSYKIEDGYHFAIHPERSETLDGESMFYNNALTNSLITDQNLIDTLKAQILGTVHTPIAKPVFETIPDPLGANWAQERIGKPDSSAYIQGLIDTNGIADLPEGVFYIGSTIKVNAKAGIYEGVIGQGTGKTVICGLTDDFPLITVYNSDDTVPIARNTQGNMTLANLTLQGGETGLYFPPEIRLIAYSVWKHVVFRNQKNGIHFKWNFGFDNNIVENFCFVNCEIGINNDPKFNDGSQQVKDYYLGYVDKTLFYNCQFINCGTGAIISSRRACNLNHFTECNFNGNALALDMRGNLSSSIINSEFTNNTGNEHGELILAGGLSLYSCELYNNSSRYALNFQGAYIEGCNFLDNNTMFSPRTHNTLRLYLANSTVQGALGSGGGTDNDFGVFINNNFIKEPALNKLLVNKKEGVTTTIIDAPTNPYPQFFVKH